MIFFLILIVTVKRVSSIANNQYQESADIVAHPLSTNLTKCWVGAERVKIQIMHLGWRPRCQITSLEEDR